MAVPVPEAYQRSTRQGGVLWRNSDWGSGGNDATVTIPADTEAGDLMIIHTANKNANGYINVPAGWTLVDEEVGALTPARLWRIAGAGDAGTDLLIDQVSTAGNATAVIDVFYGHNPDDPFMDLGIISDPGNVQSSWPTPDVTADGPGLLVTAGFQETVWDNLTSPPEITELTYGADSARTISAVTGSKAVSEAGAVGQFDYTQHTAARVKTSALLIRQAGVVPPDTVARRFQDGGSDNGEITLTIDTAIEVGDLMVMSLYSSDDDPQYAATGWASLVNAVSVNRAGMQVFTRTADATDAAGGNTYLFDPTTSANTSWIFESFYTNDPGVDVLAATADFVLTTTNQQPIPCPSVTAGIDNSLLLCVGGMEVNTGFTATAPLTLSYFQTQGINCDMVSGYEQLGVAGATGDREFVSEDPRASIGVSIIISTVGPYAGPTLQEWTKNNALASSSLTLTKPDNVAVGDMLIIMVGNDYTADAAQWDAVTYFPPGFTFLKTAGNTNSDAHVGIFWRIADGTETATVAVPCQSANDYFGWYARIASDEPWRTPLFGVEETQSYGQLVVIPSMDSPADALGFYLNAFDGGDATFSVSPLPWTMIDQNNAGTGTGNACGSFGTAGQRFGGATGDVTVDATLSDGQVGIQFVVATMPVGYPLLLETIVSEDSISDTNQVVELPANIQAGDGLLLLQTRRGSTVIDWGAFTLIESVAAEYHFADWAYKEADGNEGNSVTFVTSGSEKSLTTLFHFAADSIDGWDSSPPEVENFETANVKIWEPQELTVSWGKDLTYWFAVLSAAQSTADWESITTFPVDFLEVSNYLFATEPLFIIAYMNWIEAAAVDPTFFQTTRNSTIAVTSTVGIRPSQPLWNGAFALTAEADIAPDGGYTPALFTGSFSLDGQADLDMDGFFFEDVFGLFDLSSVASLDATGTHIPPVWNSWFSLDGEAALGFSGLAETFGEFDLTGEASLEVLGVYLPVGSGAFALVGRADLDIYADFDIPIHQGAFDLEAVAALTATGSVVVPVFTGQFVLGAVASLSAEALFLPLVNGGFSVGGEAHLGTWAQVPLQPGTGGSVRGDKRDPARVWSLEKAPTVDSEQHPADVGGEQ